MMTMMTTTTMKASEKIEEKKSDKVADFEIFTNVELNLIQSSFLLLFFFFSSLLFSFTGFQFSSFSFLQDDYEDEEEERRRRSKPLVSNFLISSSINLY